MSGMAEGAWQALATTLLNRCELAYEAALSGLDASALNWQRPWWHNSLGWLGWHIARSFDRNGAELIGIPQLWVEGGFRDRFGLTAGLDETGYGQDPELAAATVWTSGAMLVEYHRAAVSVVREYCKHADDGDCWRNVVSTTLGNQAAVLERIAGMVADALQHLGQMSVIVKAQGAGGVALGDRQ
jgi:hypothetical protein